MNCTAKITVTCDSISEAMKIKELFSSEDIALSNGRGSYELHMAQEQVTFTIQAKDLVALRAVIGSVTRVLGAYGKTIAMV